MAISTNGRISLYCFCVNLTVLLVPCLGYLSRTLKLVVEDYWIIMSLVYALGIQLHILTVYKNRGYAYKIAWRSGLLGFFFGLGILIACLAQPSWNTFGFYVSHLSFFHFSEYLTTAIINPKSLSLDSFLLNHSKEYVMAAVFSWLEFFLEWYFFPNSKVFSLIVVLGLIMCIGGEMIRKGAMFTARTNFNHIIQSHREEGHVLVVHGIYGWCRHPSYCGWFLWSIGTQVTLQNPFCSIVYAAASWRFFKQRVVEEEITLLNFFGEDYVNYQRKVPTGLPFINGYRLEL
ncbi:protein-S-isoprenylcysteine O-methyltransferase [Parasteatoda tepidariorum]|uniref:protein-S-isoprenylcysteine O-methyltransferase n=1 Tax=Parasteatoda tepidariorum TaxID=114398 RepID=UPI00077FA18F|nr:protein-S-isoprenylcysteine O-methyltransferase [Parasteatoda tepidariorum]